MNLSRKWLNEFVEIQATDKEFDEAMTLSGSKVELTTRMDAEIQNVVVGKIVEMVRHENSDHMWVCQMDVGRDELVQIVTGAQNQKVGDLVPVALHNSLLPGGVKITKGKLRGVLSNGMCCSFKELGLTHNDFPDAYEDGLWILNDEGCYPGQDINEVIGNDDSVVEFEITNNRPDCFSVIGLAREVAATFEKPLKLHEPVVHGGGAGNLPELLDVDVQATDLCPRYTARMVRNVNIAPSPKWMRQRLRASGVRPINNIVDITNYVMLEYGQPMHAFDYRYVNGHIVVRRAVEGDTMRTLDGVDRPLKPGMLVIADAEKPVGLAGIMGGENSEIVDDTVDVVFESANFDGTSIRQTALALGMRTEASAKFEKGLDILNTLPSVNRACELVELLGAGEVVDGVIDVLNYVPQPVELPLEPEKINHLLGLELSADEMKSYLKRLDIEVDGMTVKVPSWRPDLRCMADLAEEVGRLYGYNKMPTTMFKGVTTQGKLSQAELLERKAGAACRAMGYDEIMTYSFDSPSMFDDLRLPEASPLRNTIKILNPLGEDRSIMRTTAIPSMLEVLARNDSYHTPAVRLYELAKVYLPQEEQVLPEEPKYLMLGGYGDKMDFYALKGAVESVLSAVGTLEPEFAPVTDNPVFHPGRCASVRVNGKDLGLLGQIHPLTAANYDLDCDVYVAELNFTAMAEVLAPEAVYHPLPKYQAVNRDLALVCDEALTVAELEKCIASAGGALLRKVTLFDIYRGVGVPAGKKSVAFSLELRADDRTLTDSDSDGVISKVLAKLEQSLGVTLR